MNFAIMILTKINFDIFNMIFCMVAKLKLKVIDGRAPPGVELVA